MDEKVLAAMARWPDVPDVYGWLSLTEQGQWRLHPLGDALEAAEARDRLPATSRADGMASPEAAASLYGPGEAITSPPLLRFIDRNYSHDVHGQWYFQNGPQKVYVRLDGAPYILQTSLTREGGLTLQTHNGLAVTTIASWWLDDTGRLYAMTDQGPGLVAGRDMPGLLETLTTTAGDRLLDVLDDTNLGAPAYAILQVATGTGIAPLSLCHADDIPAGLGFVRFPRPLSAGGGTGP